MATRLIRDLRDLRVQVLHPLDAEGMTLVEHLRRIGCECEATWPLPEDIDPSASIVIVSIEQENREKILNLFQPVAPTDPALLAVVSFEDPSTLQVVLECGAVGVIERPIRPFGLLTNLVIARAIWLERQDANKRIRKLERRLVSNNLITKAKTILMQSQSLTEEAAYDFIRKRAMAKRMPMDELAGAIISAHELLTSKSSDA